MSIRESVLCIDRLSNTFYQHIPSCLHHALSTCTAVSSYLVVFEPFGLTDFLQPAM